LAALADLAQHTEFVALDHLCRHRRPPRPLDEPGRRRCDPARADTGLRGHTATKVRSSSKVSRLKSTA
jgi:hypothetical protein